MAIMLFYTSRILSGLRDRAGYIACQVTVFNEKRCFCLPESYHFNGHVQSKRNHIRSYCETQKLCSLLTVNRLVSDDGKDHCGSFGKLTPKRAEMELDEDEEAENIYAEKRANAPLSNTNCWKCHKEFMRYIEENDVRGAEHVLDEAKKNGIRLMLETYNCFLEYLCKRGHLLKCQHLYQEMLYYKIEPDSKTFVSLLNAAAEDENANSLKFIEKIRSTIQSKQHKMTLPIYNMLIKGYGRHNKIVECFNIMDEILDRKIQPDELTYTFLLHAAINHGIKYVLVVWHLMHMMNIKPNIGHYNLILEGIKLSNTLDISLHDSLIPGKKETQIELNLSVPSNLLTVPPTVNKDNIELNISRHQQIQLNAVPSEPNTNERNISTSISTAVLLLNEGYQCNRLLLFGDFGGLLNHIVAQGLTPNTRTYTLLLQCLPNEDAIESTYLASLEQKDIKCDIIFFNVLIKRMCYRYNYSGAKNVLNIIQARDLLPTVHTYECLSAGCRTHDDAMELLNGMEDAGYVPSSKIMENIIANACYKQDFPVLRYAMNYILTTQMTPSRKTWQRIIIFRKVMLTMIEKKSMEEHKTILQDNFHAFQMHYSAWKQKLLAAGRHTQFPENDE